MASRTRGRLFPEAGKEHIRNKLGVFRSVGLDAIHPRITRELTKRITEPFAIETVRTH